MPDAPNTAPAFMQTTGLLGVPVELTNQVCTRDTPGSTPVVGYDSSAEYAQGNGALVEMIDIQVTGNAIATVVMMFDRYTGEVSPKWRKVAEIAVAAAAISNTSVLPSYKIPLKDILFPVPGGSSLPQFQGYRINSKGMQLGFALTVAVGTSPLIIRMYGGEY